MIALEIVDEKVIEKKKTDLNFSKVCTGNFELFGVWITFKLLRKCSFQYVIVISYKIILLNYT